MKRFVQIFALLFCIFSTINAQDISQLTAQCAASAGDNVTFLKEFPVKLDASTPGGAPNTARFALLLNKSTKYRFSVCTAPNSDGEAILQVFDANTLQGSTFLEATGKDYPSFDLNCQKTGIYHVFISFKEGKSGEAVGILSFVKRL